MEGGREGGNEQMCGANGNVNSHETLTSRQEGGPR